MPTQLLISLILCYTLFFTKSLSSELCNPEDKATLFEIKQYFGNPYTLASWTNNSDCCKDWYIVDCDPTTHRINSFHLFSGQVNGQIPPAIANLPYLTTLTLRKQPNITGSIPSTITKLKYLQYLFLDYNSLSGPVPSFLNRLTNLNLNSLALDRNQLTGSIPESFGHFKSSNFYLYLSHNNLSGSIPTSLVGLSLTYIDVSRNNLSGDASLLFSNYIQHIDVSRNLFEFNLSDVEFGGTNLQYIDLNHNKIYGNIPQSLANLTQNGFFNASYNRLCGKIPTGGFINQLDQYSFFHNRCLCGTPLPPCK